MSLQLMNANLIPVTESNSYADSIILFDIPMGGLDTSLSEILTPSLSSGVSKRFGSPAAPDSKCEMSHVKGAPRLSPRSS